MHRIKKIGVYQTAKVIGIIYFFISAVIMIPIGLLGSLSSILDTSGMGGFELAFVIIGPFFYGIIGFFGTALACWIYNLIAGSTGGIEVDLVKMGVSTEETEPT